MPQHPGPMTSRTLLARLVAFDTTSSKSNLDMMAWIQEYLQAHEVSSQLIYNEEKTKASLFATMGPKSETGGIGLSGHSDVVPVTGQDWSHDPFCLHEQDGKLFGRGTCDMKGFIACALAAVPAFQKARLQKPVHLLFSYDEEIGCTGVRPMIELLGDKLPKPEILIVGEPTQMQVVDAHKSIHAYETHVRGHEAHSSLTHLGVSAIRIAARLIGELENMMAEVQQTRDPRFSPPYTSWQVGLIQGGTASNIIPGNCTFSWGLRALPDQNPAEIPQRLEAFARSQLLPEMRAIAPETFIETRLVNEVPGLGAPPDSAAISLVLNLSGQNETVQVAYGTEAGLFEQAGCSTVVCGPGSIAQAHKPDEFIEIAELEKCDAFLKKLTEYLS